MWTPARMFASGVFFLDKISAPCYLAVMDMDEKPAARISGDDSEGFFELLDQAAASPLDTRNLGLDLWEEYYREVGVNPVENGVFVARVDGEPAGFVCATPNERGFAYLSSLFVSPRFRKRGLGRRLIEHVKGEFKVDRFHAYVHAQNAAMENLMRSVSGDTRKSGSWNDWIF